MSDRSTEQAREVVEALEHVDLWRGNIGPETSQARKDSVVLAARLRDVLKERDEQIADIEGACSNHIANARDDLRCAREALRTVRAECDLPDHIAEIVGDALDDTVHAQTADVTVRAQASVVPPAGGWKRYMTIDPDKEALAELERVKADLLRAEEALRFYADKGFGNATAYFARAALSPTKDENK